MYSVAQLKCIHSFLIVQELAHKFGGRVAPGLKREYGKASVSRVEGCNSPLFEGLPEEFIMWMSHGDKLHSVPEGFKAVGKFVLLVSTMILMCVVDLVCIWSYIFNIFEHKPVPPTLTS